MGTHGVIVFSAEGGLFRVPDTGGTPTPLTTLDPGAKEGLAIGRGFCRTAGTSSFCALDSISN